MAKRFIPKEFNLSAQDHGDRGARSRQRPTLGSGAESCFSTLKALDRRPPQDATLSELCVDELDRAPRVAAAPQPWAE
jgi:hypothetical protein